MKKIFGAIMTIVLILLASVALAAGPVGGLKTVRLPDEASLAAEMGTDIQVEYGELVTGTPIHFKVTGGQTGYTYALTVVVDWTDVCQYIYDMDTDPECTYTFYEPGEYILFVMDAQGYVKDVEVLDVAGTDYVGAKVREIVGRCPAGDDYSRALWLHDYLATHTYYDSTLVYHGADVLLMKGYGVCQSYGEAYRKLLRAAGIPCEVVSAERMGHEWNAMKLNGKWYEVDVTWDTLGYYPAGQGHAESTCRYTYFAIPDEIMRYDHFGHERSDCVSMDDNYFVRSGEAETWAADYLDEVSAALTGDSMQLELTVEDIDFSDPYSWYRQDLAAAGVACVLNGMLLDGADGASYEIAASHVPDGYQAMSTTVVVEGRQMAPAITEYLNLPAGVTEIGEQAFYGAGCIYAVVPEGCERIGAGAFGGNTALQYVELPETVTTIAADAFAGSSNVCLIVTAGSTAQSWAEEHGVSYQIK